MSGTTVVDVVIPTTGRESLRRAVECVNSQTVTTRAIVVLDRPGEEQNLRRLLSGLHYELVLTAGGARAAVARNLGLDRVQAEYVAFLDDDDWWGRSRLERLLSAVPNRHVDKEFLVGSFFHFVLPDSSHRIIPYTRPAESAVEGWMPSYLVRRKGLKFGESAMQTSTMLMSASLARRTRWRPELRKHQDWDFITRLLQTPDVKFFWSDDDQCFVQKDSPGSISKSMDWQASLTWIEEVDSNTRLTLSSKSDFLWVHVLRAAIAQRSLAGIVAFIKSKPFFPHPAAVVLGISGLTQLLKSRK